MNADKFKNDLMLGETSSVEFKRCGNEVEHDVFESICAFLNRFGGDVYLGVLNDGTVVGVNANNAVAMMKNIVNVVGNPNVFKPSPYIEVDSFVWDSKTVIRVHVPVSGDVHSYRGDIYDRMGEVDVKVRATAQIADLYMRKKGIYTEREVFPSLDKSEFVIERERMYTSNPCNPMQDGRITPENVRPRAKNPIIAGFFREIGRADRLGSGVRNLYKYCKDYGGADPVFTEGNCFVISVSLKKLDPIRFPFKKQPIRPDEQPIGGKKPSIDPQKTSIGPEKPSIDDLASKYGLTRPTSENIHKLLCAFGSHIVFGRSMIMAETGLEITAVGVLINTMLQHHLLDTVKGHGKGKYRFRATLPSDQNEAVEVSQ